MPAARPRLGRVSSLRAVMQRTRLLPMTADLCAAADFQLKSSACGFDACKNAGNHKKAKPEEEL